MPITQVLRPHLEAHLKTIGRFGATLLFTDSLGNPIRVSNWRSRVFAPAAKAVGLYGLTPHGLRHSFAALAIQAGANPKMLQEILGHSDIRLTMDTYAALFADDMDVFSAGFDAAFGQSAPGENASKMRALHPD